MGLKYTLRIQESLLFAIKHASGHPYHQVLSFFDGKVSEMVAAEPNIKKFRKNKYSSEIKVENPVWILRGYYTGTPVFFKLTVVKPQEGAYIIPADEDYFVRVIDPNKPKILQIKSEAIADGSAEGELLGGDMEVPLKKQRIMHPKGVKSCPFEKKK